MAAALVVPPITADAPTIVVPLAFNNPDCRATTFAVEDHGGCSAAFEGSIAADCDAAGCDVVIDLVGTGTRGASTPEPLFTTVRLLYFLVGVDGLGGFDTEHGQACRVEQQDVGASCAATLARSMHFAPDVSVDADCFQVALDVESRSTLGPAALFATHTVTSRGVEDGDTRTIAPQWYVCHKDGGFFAIESGWLHTPF